MKRPSACLPMAAVVLAAGSASRMGQLKQIMPFRGRTLIENAVVTAMEAAFDPIIVVVGAQSIAVRSLLASQPVEMVENQRWLSGMGSSISAGVSRLQELGCDSAAVAILLADQPLVTASHLRAMRSLLFGSGKLTVAARYGGVLGVPAFFKRTLFSTLAALEPSVGARSLLREDEQGVLAYDLAEAAVDVDTPDDFAKLAVSTQTGD